MTNQDIAIWCIGGWMISNIGFLMLLYGMYKKKDETSQIKSQGITSMLVNKLTPKRKAAFPLRTEEREMDGKYVEPSFK